MIGMNMNSNNDFIIVNSYENSNKQFGTKQFITKFIIRNASDMPEESLKDYIGQIIDRAYEMTEASVGITPNKFAILFSSPALDQPISIPFRPKEFFTTEMILNEIDMLEVTI
jgi:hypothetical protein